MFLDYIQLFILPSTFLSLWLFAFLSHALAVYLSPALYATPLPFLLALSFCNSLSCLPSLTFSLVSPCNVPPSFTPPSLSLRISGGREAFSQVTRSPLGEFALSQLRLQNEFYKAAPFPLQALLTPIMLPGQLALSGVSIMQKVGTFSSPSTSLVRVLLQGTLSLSRFTSAMPVVLFSKSSGSKEVRGARAGSLFSAIPVEHFAMSGVSVMKIESPFPFKMCCRRGILLHRCALHT